MLFRKSVQQRYFRDMQSSWLIRTAGRWHKLYHDILSAANLGTKKISSRIRQALYRFGMTETNQQIRQRTSKLHKNWDLKRPP